jgi:hypothetical protein
MFVGKVRLPYTARNKMIRKSLIIIMICALFILPTESCKKSTPASTNTTTLQKLSILEAKYKNTPALTTKATVHHYAAKEPPNPYGTIVADGLGALSGAFLGPFGAFCGGVCASINYSFGWGWDSPIANPVPVSTNSSNPYDNYGIMHNNTCAYIVSIDNAQTPFSSYLGSVKLYGQDNWSAVLTGTAPDATITSMVNIIMSNTGVDGSINIEGALTGLMNAGYITLQEYQIEDEYFNTFINSSDPINYSISAEAIINSSNDLSLDAKKQILISMSVSRNSYVIWGSF